MDVVGLVTRLVRLARIGGIPTSTAWGILVTPFNPGYHAAAGTYPAISRAVD